MSKVTDSPLATQGNILVTCHQHCLGSKQFNRHLVTGNLWELNGPAGILNLNIYHHMRTVISFAMMVVVICEQNIEIEFVQVCSQYFV